MARELVYVFFDTVEGGTWTDSSSADYRASYIEGVLVSESAVITSDGRVRLENGITLEEARQSSGEWIGVFKSATKTSDLRIAADPLGYQPIFYRQVVLPRGGAALLVANSFRAICGQARAMGAKMALNRSAIATVLGTDHAWATTMQSQFSFEASTKILLPTQEIQISGGKWSISQCSLFDGGGLGYRELLERGIEKSINQLKCATQMDVAQRRINLSGGRDSRMAVALLAAAGVVEDYVVTTVNPETWVPASARPGLFRDLVVSNTIREHFGLKWAPPMEMERTQLDFEHSLDFWQSFRSQKNYRFKAARYLESQLQPNIEIRGAAGETFRGFDAVKTLKAYPILENTPDSFDNDVRRVVKGLYGDSFLSEDFEQDAEDAVREELNCLGGATITEALHRRYAVYRNRSHFGHVRASMSLGQIPILPLSQPEFVQAAGYLSEGERYDNMVAFDLIEASYPDLNVLEFDKGGWPNSERFQSTSTRTWAVHDEGPGIREFFNNQRIFREQAEMRAKTASSVPFDARFKAINQIKESALVIEESQGVLPYSLQVKLLSQIEGKRLNPFTLLGKLRSIQDGLGDFGRYDTIVVENPMDLKDRLSIIDSSYARVNIRAEQPFFRVDLTVGEESARAQVSAIDAVSYPLTYTMHLLTDDGVAQRVEAGPSGFHDFENLKPGVKYRVQVFAYYQGRKSVPFKFFSRFFTVSNAAN